MHKTEVPVHTTEAALHCSFCNSVLSGSDKVQKKNQWSSPAWHRRARSTSDLRDPQQGSCPQVHIAAEDGGTTQARARCGPSWPRGQRDLGESGDCMGGHTPMTHPLHARGPVTRFPSTSGAIEVNGLNWLLQ